MHAAVTVVATITVVTRYFGFVTQLARRYIVRSSAGLYDMYRLYCMYALHSCFMYRGYEVRLELSHYIVRSMLKNGIGWASFSAHARVHHCRHRRRLPPFPANSRRSSRHAVPSKMSPPHIYT